MSTYIELRESINFQLQNGIDPNTITSEITKLAIMETPLRAKNAIVDRRKSRRMSRPSTRNRIRKAANRPANRMKMRKGYERWLKLKGSKELSRTASKRFESYSNRFFEIEDVRLAVANNLVDVTKIFGQFNPLIHLEDCTSDLEKMEYLYNNFHEKFNELFLKELERNGVIMDPVEEDTTTPDIAIGDGMPYDNVSPFYTKDKKRLKRNSLDLFPLIVHEMISTLYELLESNEEDAPFQDEILELIGELEFCFNNPTAENIKEVENFQDFIFNIVTKDFNEEEQMVAEMAASASLRRQYESFLFSLVREGKSISKSSLQELKTLLGTI